MSELRIDLTEYRPYIETLRDKLNEDGVYTMSLTDAVSIFLLPKVGGVPPLATNAIR